MGEFLTPEEAAAVDLSRNPFKRRKQVAAEIAKMDLGIEYKLGFDPRDSLVSAAHDKAFFDALDDIYGASERQTRKELSFRLIVNDNIEPADGMEKPELTIVN